MTKLCRAAAVALALTGCTHMEPNPRANDTLRTQLLAADTAFSELSRLRGAPEAFRAYFAEDATSLPMGEPAIHGRDNIFAAMSANPAGTLTWKPQAADVSASGDLGYTWGLWEFQTIGADGQPKAAHGKYISVWKRQADGSWKIVLDGGNTNPPPRK